MDDSLPRDRAHPLHSPWTEADQFRLKVQKFTHTGPVLTVRRVSFDAYNDRILNAYRRALPFTREGDVINLPPRRLPDPTRPRSPEDIERSRRRAAKGLRDSIRELAPEGMLTLTSRLRLHDLDVGRRVVARFLRSIKPVSPEFAAVIVPEKNPSGEGLHFHLAYRGLGDARWNTLRRLWHCSLLAEEGEAPRYKGALLRGSDSPGNIDVKKSKGGRVAGSASRIGRYMGKYLSKEAGVDWGLSRKAFTCTQNVNLQAARLYYLNALDPAHALIEGLELAGYGVGTLSVPGVRVWSPPDSSVTVLDLAPLPPD